MEPLCRTSALALTAVQILLAEARRVWIGLEEKTVEYQWVSPARWGTEASFLGPAVCRIMPFLALYLCVGMFFDKLVRSRYGQG